MYVLYTALIILVAGICGGTLNQLQDSEQEPRKSFLTSILASSLVPLVLYVGDSQVLEHCLKGTQESAFFALFGMSVIAAIYGDRFISSVSDKWLADQLDEQKKITQSLTDAMLATEHTLDVSKVSGLSKEEQDILSAMSASPIKFLSLTTLQNNLGHDQKLSDLRKNLQNLEDEGVVSSLVGHDHKERFFIIGKELQ